MAGSRARPEGPASLGARKATFGAVTLYPKEMSAWSWRRMFKASNSSEPPVHGKQGPRRTSTNTRRKKAVLYAIRLKRQQELSAWSLRSIQLKLVKIGAKVISHARSTIFQLAEVAVSESLFVEASSPVFCQRKPRREHGEGVTERSYRLVEW